MIAKPTRTYTSLDAAYDHFNRELFSGQLPAVPHHHAAA